MPMSAHLDPSQQLAHLAVRIANFIEEAAKLGITIVEKDFESLAYPKPNGELAEILYKRDDCIL